MKKIEDNTMTHGQLFQELQNCINVHVQEHFVELKRWNVYPYNDQGFLNKMRADIVQVVALAKQNTKASWHVKFENWSSWRQRKLAQKEPEISEK